MAYAHPQPPIRADRRRHHRTLQHLAIVQLLGAAHGQIVARAAAHQRHLGGGHVVGAAHHLHLTTAAEAIGEQHQGGVLAPLQPLQAARGFRRRGPQSLLLAAPEAGAHANAGAAQGPEHQAMADRRAAGDLPGARAADRGRVAQPLAQVRRQRCQRLARGRHLHQQLRRSRQIQLREGFLQRLTLIGKGGSAHPYPALLFTHGYCRRWAPMLAVISHGGPQRRRYPQPALSRAAKAGCAGTAPTARRCR